MKTVTMLEFRRDAEGILRRVVRGERFVLTIVRRAMPSPRGPTRHTEIDRLFYGRR